MFDDSNRFRSETQSDNDPSLTLAPMIDVVFLLLIFFMVSTTFIVRPGLNLNLPVSDDTVETPSEQWVISVDPEGTIFLDQEKITIETLQRTIQADKKPVTLRADRAVPHGMIVEVLESVKDAGIESMNITTKVPQDSTGE